jgi:endo-1,4-beta-mannosidase
MQSLNSLLSVCYLFKQGQFDVEAFQSRIFTAAIPDSISKEFAKQLANFDNRLEEIIYCSSPSSRKESAEKVANDLIQATLVEQKRLDETGSYKSSDN